MGVREKPTIRIGSGKRFLRNKLYKAGINLRLVKSPDAPKIVKEYILSSWSMKNRKWEQLNRSTISTFDLSMYKI
jgi:hypothetical protein